MVPVHHVSAFADVRKSALLLDVLHALQDEALFEESCRRAESSVDTKRVSSFLSREEDLGTFDELYPVIRSRVSEHEPKVTIGRVLAEAAVSLLLEHDGGSAVGIEDPVEHESTESTESTESIDADDAANAAVVAVHDADLVEGTGFINQEFVLSTGDAFRHDAIVRIALSAALDSIEPDSEPSESEQSSGDESPAEQPSNPAVSDADAPKPVSVLRFASLLVFSVLLSTGFLVAYSYFAIKPFFPVLIVATYMHASALFWVFVLKTFIFGGRPIEKG